MLQSLFELVVIFLISTEIPINCKSLGKDTFDDAPSPVLMYDYNMAPANPTGLSGSTLKANQKYHTNSDPKHYTEQDYDSFQGGGAFYNYPDNIPGQSKGSNTNYYDYMTHEEDKMAAPPAPNKLATVITEPGLPNTGNQRKSTRDGKNDYTNRDLGINIRKGGRTDKLVKEPYRAKKDLPQLTLKVEKDVKEVLHDNDDYAMRMNPTDEDGFQEIFYYHPGQDDDKSNVRPSRYAKSNSQVPEQMKASTRTVVAPEEVDENESSNIPKTEKEEGSPGTKESTRPSTPLKPVENPLTEKPAKGVTFGSNTSSTRSSEVFKREGVGSNVGNSTVLNETKNSNETASDVKSSTITSTPVTNQQVVETTTQKDDPARNDGISTTGKPSVSLSTTKHTEKKAIVREIAVSSSPKSIRTTENATPTSTLRITPTRENDQTSAVPIATTSLAVSHQAPTTVPVQDKTVKSTVNPVPEKRSNNDEDIENISEDDSQDCSDADCK